MNNDDLITQLNRLNETMEKIHACLNHLATEGIFVSIDEDLSQN